MNRNDLVRYLNERLEISSFKDSSINGLQVEGKTEINKIALVTDAALKLFERAAEMKCDMIIAHHGMIWGGLSSITGRIYQQIKLLLDNGINLYASHLPLDAHPELGNNAALAKLAKLENTKPFGDYHGQFLGFSGSFKNPITPSELAIIFKNELGKEPMVLPFGKEKIKTAGIISGGASGSLQEAIDCGLDCFITGEGKHENFHLALEAKINVIYLGHYHSETLGVKAVGEELKTKFGIDCIFIDEPTVF